MKGLIQIQIIAFLFLGLTTQAAINKNVQPTENDYLIILKDGETTTPKDKLEKRTFRIGDNIVYSTNDDFKIQKGEIVGFDDDHIFVITETKSALEIPIKELRTIQKNRRWYKLYRKYSKRSLISLGVGGLIYLLLAALAGEILFAGLMAFLGGTLTSAGIVSGIGMLIIIGTLLQVLLITLGLLLLFTLIAFIVSRSRTPKFVLGKRWRAKLKKH